MLEIIQSHPRISIIVLSGLVSLFITTVNFFLLDKNKVRASREKQKRIREELKNYKNDPVKTIELQKEQFSDAMENMRHSLKPMLVTIIPSLLVFVWIRGTFAETTIAGSWLWYYIISAIVFSIIFRKLFKLP